MSYGLTSGVTVNIQTLNEDGTISKRSEGVPASRITKSRQAAGLFGVKFSEYFTFRNFNYERPLTGVEDILDKDVIDVIDKRILQAQNPELFDIKALEAEILEINNLINVYRNSQKNTTDEENLERLSDELYCLTMLLENKLGELNQLLIARGIKSANPLLVKLLSLDILGILDEEEVTPIDTDAQLVTVTWDAVDQFINYQGGPGTGPTDNQDITITITTDDGMPLESDIDVAIVVDGGTMAEGVEYVLTNFSVTLLAGTINGHSYVATYDAFDGVSPDDANLTLTAVGATPVGTIANPLTVTWSAVL